MNVNSTYGLVRDHLLNDLRLPPETAEWVNEYRTDISYLSRLHRSVRNRENMIYDRRRGIFYDMNDDVWTVRGSGFTFEIHKDSLLKAVQVTCDMLTPVLPLGSVVDMRTETLPEALRRHNPTRMRLVVASRFNHSGHSPAFFPYGGIIYPIGSLKQGKLFYFYPEMIDQIVHRSFRDEDDFSYVALMKKKLVLERGLVSASFATPQIREELSGMLSAQAS